MKKIFLKITSALVALLMLPQIVFAAAPQINAIANDTATQGQTYVKQPTLLAGGTVSWRKEFGPDDMTVNPTTGAVSWVIPATLARESFHLGVRATNGEGSTYITWVVKVGGGNFVYVCDTGATCGAGWSTGSDSNNGASKATPKKTISAGTAAMVSGDTLIIGNGTYIGPSNTMANTSCGRGDLPPAGSAGIYTTAMAEHPGGVVMDGQGVRAIIYVNGNYDARDPDGFTTCTGGHQYLAFKGIIAGNSGDSAAPIMTNHASHIKIIDCGAYDATDGTTPITSMRSEYILVEGCYTWGNGRMRIVFYINDHSIMRRNVSRHDRSNEANPIGLYDVYSGQNTRVQNNIAIDSDQLNHYLNYEQAAVGTFVDQSGSSNGEVWSQRHNNIFYNNIALNVHNTFTLTQGRPTNDSDPVTFVNNIGWAMNAISNWAIDNTAAAIITSPDYLNINQSTFGGWRSPHYPLAVDSTYGIPVSISGWANDQTITNSIFYDFKDYNGTPAGLFDSVENADHNNIFGVGQIDIKNSTVTNTITTNPTTACLKYLPRIEAGCALQTAGASGVRVGANIQTFRGKSGTMWGETGYDSETNVSVWPFPHEDLIKQKMQAYRSTDSVGPITGDRGFASSVATSIDGSPQTLTKYIWEYLGNQIPANIYGPAVPDAIPPSAPTGLSVQ